MINPELIEDCRKGNMRNFRELIRETSPFAFSAALRMLGDEDQAKDVVQESMIIVWEKIKTVRSADSYRTWVYKIVINKCYDQLRRMKKKPERRADEQTWALISNHISSDQPSELESRETAMIIKMLTERLSPKQKAVFVLGEIEEMTHEEISSITGLSRMNVKANLHHARKRIREMIKKYI
jgi:RNA polymerase sigma-70 factor (ECF subfamily)